jgi:hypothetical protein
MADASWQIRGEYFESCSCEYLCPCIVSHTVDRPTNGDCIGALVFHVDEGRYGKLVLDGLSVVYVLFAPEALVKGNWSVGVIVDERASTEQQDALATIVTGKAGGPMAIVIPLTGTFLGVEAKPIHFEKSGLRRSVSVPGMLDQAVDGVAGAANPAQPLYFDNTAHTANSRLALAKATHSHLHAFGINWDDNTGRNNGHFAPFDRKSS